MSKALILSDKPLLTRKEEQALAAANVRVTALSRFHEDLLSNSHGDYDIIVIDDSLRGEDLDETCRLVRGASEAFIILLGTRPSWEMWEKGEEIGFNRYYKKPVPPRELGTKIKLAAYEQQYRTKPAPPEQGDRVTAAEVTPEETVQIEVRRPEPVSVPENPAPVACSPAPPPVAPPDNAANIWQDPKVASLMSRLLSGKIIQLCPEVNLSLADGFSYREADAIMGTTGRGTALMLESLAKEGLLVKQDYDRILVSPAGSMQLVPVERCPQCDSSELTRGQLIEHFSCGYIGLEEEFAKGLDQVCPKCKRELKLIGTDYRKPGLRYICNGCHGVFPSPAIKCRCLKTGEVYPLQEIHYLRLYSYRLNEAHKKRLEFELEPKRQLIECLVHLGYDVREGVQVKGRSGATHTIDLVASIDDLLIRHTVAIGILAAPHEKSEVSLEALFGFDSKAYDAGIENKMVIAVPGFSSEALKFAERQGIRMYRLEDLKALLGGKIQGTEIIAVKKEPRPAAPGETDPTKLGPTGWLKWLLEKRGYHVTEKLKLAGRSGAEHVLDIYAEKDDGIVNHKLAACVIMNEGAVSSDVNEVIKFDAAAYDAHIRDKIIISVPRLSKEARQFADYQRIKVLEAKELAAFSGRYEADDAARRFSALLSNS
jgi:CheY-like chemotaxis protein